MKELFWLGSSLRDLRAFPVQARIDAGTDLRLVQQGSEPLDWKPMPTIGPGVREIRVRCAEGAFRVVYVVAKGPAVYVLHAFQKKSLRTAGVDIDKARARYKLVP